LSTIISNPIKEKLLAVDDLWNVEMDGASPIMVRISIEEIRCQRYQS